MGSTIGMHMHWWALSIGVATVANKKALFVMLVDRIPRFDAHWSHFFAEFDSFFMITSPIDTYISRYGDFCANNDDDTTDYFTPCACVRGNNIMDTPTFDSNPVLLCRPLNDHPQIRWIPFSQNDYTLHNYDTNIAPYTCWASEQHQEHITISHAQGIK